MWQPRLLDLFCCEGGASVGYSRAGFLVEGMDLFEDFSQKRYPFPSWKQNVRDVKPEWIARYFDVVVASPPCQHASIATSGIDRSRYPKLIEPTRELLEATGLPYVIENVKGAALHNPITLCGTMFGLSAVDDDGEKVYLQRHRLFESNIPLTVPEHAHPRNVQWAGSYGGARRDKVEARTVRHGGYVPSKRVQQALLGIDWMTERGMHQAIPPAYTEHIGAQLITYLKGRQ